MANRFTVAWRSILLPAKCFTSTTSFGGSGTDDRGIPVTPIISIASEDTGFSSLNQHLGAITIVFDFVNPVLALWWLINQGGKLGLDEPEPCRKHYFCTGLDRLQKKPPTVSARAPSDSRWRE